MTDCRNACRDPIVFPRRIGNRPALDRIAYRIGSYADIREALLHGLDGEPELTALTHRASDDPAIAVLEGAAIVGDILTFYQEAYANEKYIRTAAWRESMSEIVRLLGYRLAPGVGGRATFAFEIRAGAPVEVPMGFRLSAEVTGRDGQSDFETIEQLMSYPALSRFALHRPSVVSGIASGTSRFSIDAATLEAAGVTLAAGDRILIVADPNSDITTRQVVVVDSVRPQFDRIEVVAKGAWTRGAIAGGVAYKLGRSFRHFGYNAPPQYVELNSSNVAVNRSPVFWRATGLAPGYLEAILMWEHLPLPTMSSFPLDQAADDLSEGAIMLAELPLGTGSLTPTSSGSMHFFERRIVRAHAETLTVGPMTGGTTVVDLDGHLARPGLTIGSTSLVFSDLRAMYFHEVLGQRFAIAGPRVATGAADLSRLEHYGDAQAYAALKGRRVQLVRGDTLAEVVVDTDPAAPATGEVLRPLRLSPPPAGFTLADFPIDPPDEERLRVYAWGNLVDATQGRTEREAVLGNGDNRQAFQTFRLPKAPLTYHVAAGHAPPQRPELDVFVAGRRWELVDSFFGHGPHDEICIVREDAKGDSWLQFGDGCTGARLPSGVGNVRAVFRTGQGAHGPLRDGTNVQPGGRLDRLAKLRLHGLSTGGDQPETADNARAAAPGKIRSLGRMVSITDFEAEALAIPGVWRASARWSLVSNVPAIVVTVLMTTRRAAQIEAVRGTLADYNRCRGPQRHSIVIVAGALTYLCVDMSVSIDPREQEETVLGRVREALGVAGLESADLDGSKGLLATGRRRFAQREYATRLEGVAQNVPGVAWARVDALAPLGEGDDPLALVLPAAPWPFNAVADCAADRILALHRAHLMLRPVSAPAKTCG